MNIRDRDFTFGMHAQLMNPLQMKQTPMTFTKTFMLKLAKFDFVAAEGMGAFVFHKHLVDTLCKYELKCKFTYIFIICDQSLEWREWQFLHEAKSR